MNNKNRLPRFILFSLITLHCSLISIGCSSFFTRFITKSFENLPHSPDTVAAKITHPIFQNVGLSVLWVGHATCLIQIGDKIFLTDPIFTKTAGMISKRGIEPGILPSSIDRAGLYSHFPYSF